MNKTESQGGGTARSFSENGSRRLPSARALALSLVLLLVLLVGSKVLSGRPMEEHHASLERFPTRIGMWQLVGEQPVSPEVVKILNLKEYLNRSYALPSGERVSLYIGYVADQEQQPMIHSPTTCLPAAGWQILESKQVPWWEGRGEPRPRDVNVVLMGLGEDRLLVCYWIQANHRIMSGIFEYRLFLFLDSLLQRRSDGALVRFITRVGPAEDLERAEERLREFVHLAVPAIDRALPR